MFIPVLLSIFPITVIFAKEVVAKGPEEGNHKAHKEHKEKLFFSFVRFVVQGFYAFCDTLKGGDPFFRRIPCFEVVAEGQVTMLSFRTGIVLNPSDSHPKCSALSARTLRLHCLAMAVKCVAISFIFLSIGQSQTCTSPVPDMLRTLTVKQALLWCPTDLEQ